MQKLTSNISGNKVFCHEDITNKLRLNHLKNMAKGSKKKEKNIMEWC